MIHPRTPSEFWDAADRDLWNSADDDVDRPLHYPNATRRRATIAHALGIIGVVGTLGLGIAAIVPHASYLTKRAHSLFAPAQPPPAAARRVEQVPAALETTPPSAAAAPVVAPPPLATPPGPSGPAEVTPEVPASASASAVAAPEPTLTAPTATAPAASAPLTEAAAPVPGSPETTPTTAAGPVAPPAAPTSAAAPGKQESAPAVWVRRPRTEPHLTWREIERRKARYAEWLKQQGLEPVH